MDCGICMEPVDAAERRPKSLPCGHTFCLRCLNAQGNRNCASCRKVFCGAPSSLPDNFALLEMAERSAKTEPRQSAASGPRFWCRQCGKEATELCLDNEHRLCSLQKIRAEQSQPRVDALRRGVASLAALQGLLEESAPLRVVLEDCVASLKRAQGGEAYKCERLRVATLATLKSLETAQDATVWKEALKAAEPSALSQRTGPLLAALTDPASSCSVALRGGGVAWSGSVDPKDPVARLLLCRMLCAGKLRPEGTPATSTSVDAAAAPRWQERSNQAELAVGKMASRMTEGSRVVRGTDWPPGRSEGGTPPTLGTVSFPYGSQVVVHWDSGSNSSHRPDTLILVGQPILSKVSFGWVEPVHNVETTSISKHVQDKSDLLQSGQFAQASTLVGLHCNVSAVWSKTVLKQVSASVQVLDLVSPGDQHLEVVRAMPKLRELHVRLPNATQKQLQAVLQTPKLSRLEVHCPFAAPLPLPPGTRTAARLKWLRVGVHPLATALALVRANADTLEELELVAASTEPYGCPDLAGELRRCGPRRLQRLVLWRNSDFCICRHDEETCKQQKMGIFEAFLGADTVCKILCSDCDKVA